MEPTGEPGPRARVAERMRPVRGTIPAFATAESARRRMEQEALRFLVVVAPGTGRLVGAVDREALAAGACCERHAGRCTVVQHLAPDVDFCFQHEWAREVAEDEAELAAEGCVPAARRIPLLVVDDQMKPLGCFPMVSAACDASPAATACAA
ncbi:MAG TPA: hypothetical protein VFR81_00100 [Longimicrobium sp.]|nr:hypothetical protein [Longimicrobium sp.]